MPSRVPIPTSSPASSTSGQAGSVAKLGMGTHARRNASSAPPPSPSRNNQRQASVCCRAPARMPLMPATLALNSNNIRAADPISMPPPRANSHWLSNIGTPGNGLSLLAGGPRGLTPPTAPAGIINKLAIANVWSFYDPGKH
ncbi:hypothetical protein D3C80_1354880 [compost metagenome]